MKKFFNRTLLIPLVSILMFVVSQESLAWGGRGHHSICSATPHLVKNVKLKEFLQHRTHTMGHLCNIPDIYWKSLGAGPNEYGSPSHYIDPEIIGLKVTEVPLDYKEIEQKYTGKENKFKEGRTIFSIPKEFGSLWWRANQFFNLVANLKTDFSNSPIPKNYKEEQDENLTYNSTTYKLMVYMGLMGHFVGDASQPYHSTADFDGYQSGHGGIHAYFEEIVVSQFDESIEKQIVDAAKKMKDKKFLDGETALQKMQKLSAISFFEIDKVKKLDPVIKKSEVKKDKGMEIKTAAERKPASVGYKKFKDMIVTDMARSALLLAHLWEKSYEASGSPDLSAYRSYKYPFTPDFVEVDYITKETELKKEK